MRSSAAFGFCILTALACVGCERASLITRFVGRNFATLARPIKPAPFKANRPPTWRRLGLSALWVGHATILLKLDDKFVLTDPVFTDTVGQFSKRIVEPGIAVEDLPRLDAVIVSHMHFDHLSLGSLDLIEPKASRIYLPEGGAVYVPLSGVPTIELPSWHSHQVDGLRITAVPVKHNGWRYAGDRSWMTRSYTGYVIEYHDLVVYFGGDTAYTRAFADTRQHFPEIDLAILPIAPVHPRSFMCKNHTDPKEALQAFRDLGAHYFLAMHYDTFVNSLDEYGEAPRLLRELLPAYQLDERRVAILRQGERRAFE